MHKRGFSAQENLNVSAEAINLVSRMLDTNQETRISLEEIQAHPFTQVVEPELQPPAPVEEEVPVEEPEPVAEEPEEVKDSLIEVDEFDEDDFEIIDEVDEELE